MYPLHPSVTLAAGVVITPEAWMQHGEILACGIPRHRVIVREFFRTSDNMLSIRIETAPEDTLLPSEQN
jgi:hypothetical protein